MPLLIGPTGKMSIIDDIKQFDEWLKQPGFTQATAEQERLYLENARAKIAKINAQKYAETGVYLSTVSQGAKNGYSIASKNLIKEFEKAGVPVSTHYSGQKVAILFHNPYSLPRIEAPYRIIYTMFESTKIPDDWLDYLRAADEVWVPSKWNQQVFDRSGIKTKVVPLGYDEEAYTFVERTPAKKKRRDFVFLHYNAFNIRKGFTEVWKAFTKEFEKTEPVKLILKTDGNSSPLPITKSEYPNIEIIYGKITEAEMMDIMRRSDCFVFPSRGEGFGMNPLECMATGMPAILPNAHGLTEYFNADYMYEVKVKEECPALYARYKDIDVGKMYVSDVDDLRAKMRWCVNHQEDVITMGKKASEYVKQWTYTNSFAHAIERVKEIMQMEIKPSKLQNVLTLERVR
jgi:glycosyltransferase involved in cell wall biosynthesis